MSTEIAGIESESAESPPDENETGNIGSSEPGSRKGGSALTFFAFLFALISLAGVGWMWWTEQSDTSDTATQLSNLTNRLDSQNKEMASRIDQLGNDLKSLADKNSSADFNTLQRRIDADDTRVGQLANALNEQQSLARSLQSNVDALNKRLQASESALSGLSTQNLDAADELDIAEVGYLLRLANERLKLFSDPATADSALALADSHLAAIDSPMYLGVRQGIASARRQLSSTRIPDYLDISSRLDALQEQAVSLPFSSGEKSVDGEEPPAEAGWWQKVKGVFSNLVTVRRSTAEENRRISLRDKDYIRQGLWLQFEAAQLALMRQDQAAFRAALERAEKTLESWFGPDGDHYKAVLKGVEEIASIEIQVQYPDISAPWSTLTLLRNSRAASPGPATPLPSSVTQPAAGEQEDENG